jgi:hypothetical protein
MLPVIPGIRVFLPHSRVQRKIENDIERESRRKFGIVECRKREVHSEKLRLRFVSSFLRLCMPPSKPWANTRPCLW